MFVRGKIIHNRVWGYGGKLAVWWSYSIFREQEEEEKKEEERVSDNQPAAGKEKLSGS